MNLTKIIRNMSFRKKKFRKFGKKNAWKVSKREVRETKNREKMVLPQWHATFEYDMFQSNLPLDISILCHT